MYSYASISIISHAFAGKVALLFRLMASRASTTPSISLDLVIDPPRFAPGIRNSTPTMSLTAILHASQPITIFTWPTVFNLHLGQKRTNFSCHDLTSDLPLQLELAKGPQYPGFSRSKDGPDDTFFQTLEPEVPVTFSAPFKLAHRTTEGRHSIATGHRYRFAIRHGEIVRWWRYSRKEDVMVPPGEPDGLNEPSGEPIVLTGVLPVNFEVENSDIAVERHGSSEVLRI
ncbi:hypothetical protein BDV97DRAFT_358728 [Delphinella strobiligena]|nr:hypothetical protein BDV97DRAFT_358728 [Delphinella strobiligena]